MNPEKIINLQIILETLEPSSELHETLTEAIEILNEENLEDYDVVIELVETHTKKIRATSQEDAQRQAKKILQDTSTPPSYALEYKEGNPEFDDSEEQLSLKEVVKK